MDKVTRALIRIEEARQIAERLEEEDSTAIKIVPIKPSIILKDGETVVTKWTMVSKEG